MTNYNLGKATIIQNIKRAIFMLSFLFLMGLTGMFMALGDINTDYVKNQQALYLMSSELMNLETRLNNNDQKLKNYEYMAYKVNAFEKKYPKFSRIVDSVYKKSHEYGFHPDLILGLVKVESNYDPKAVSYMGAYGLMQVNLEVWRKELSIDEKNIFDVDYNIDLGLQILKRYLVESKGNMPRALHLYNNGYKYNNTKYIGKVGDSLFNLSLNRNNNVTHLAN